MTKEEKEAKEFVVNHINAMTESIKKQTQCIAEDIMWSTPKHTNELNGIESYMQEVKPMTREEKIINVAGLVYTLRDLLEEVDWNRELKQRTKNYAAYLDSLVREIAADRDVWKELDELQKHFHNNFVREKKK